jgi:hypothetical protein
VDCVDLPYAFSFYNPQGAARAGGGSTPAAGGPAGPDYDPHAIIRLNALPDAKPEDAVFPPTVVVRACDVGVWARLVRKGWKAPPAHGGAR